MAAFLPCLQNGEARNAQKKCTNSSATCILLAANGRILWTNKNQNQHRPTPYRVLGHLHDVLNREQALALELCHDILAERARCTNVRVRVRVSEMVRLLAAT